MCCLIKLDERARLAQPVERDEYYTAKFPKHLLRGSLHTVCEYINEANRAHTASKLLVLQQFIAQGQKVTSAMAFEALLGLFIDINGGRGKDIHSIFHSGLLSMLARLDQAMLVL